MKKHLIIVTLLVLGLIYACTNSNSPEELREKLISGEFDAYHSLPQLPCDSLTIDEKGKYHLGDTLFTGVCFTNYENIAAKLEIRQIFQGELHGYRMMLSPKGDTLSLNLYNHGKLIRASIGENERVNCDSLEVFTNDQGKEVRFYFGEPYTGICERYYSDIDTTAIYMRANYRNGLPEGDLIIFDRAGNEILRETFVRGEKLGN
ncbi:MAG: hypothetical protein JJT77_01525 [Crocinitomicaceae bacterium]|nr:hypothetical protein [Crocinitomicaceae bacterium]